MRIEFGPSNYPFFGFSQELEQRVLWEPYVALDVLHSDLTLLKNRWPNIECIVGDVGKIPLKDKIADEIWICNVFGGTFRNVPWPDKNGHSVYDLDAGKYLLELRRILKDGGVIFIGEWLPRLHDVDWLLSFAPLKYGLERTIYKDSSLDDFVIDKDLPPSVNWDTSHGPFFISLAKI
jgi:hypothetical protein